MYIPRKIKKREKIMGKVNKWDKSSKVVARREVQEKNRIGDKFGEFLH